MRESSVRSKINTQAAALSAFAALALLPSHAVATSPVPSPVILAPGDSTASIPDFLDGAYIIASQTVPFSSASGPVGTLTEYVVSGTEYNPWSNSDLDFAYSFSTITRDAVVSITIPGFAGFDTAVKVCNLPACIEGNGDVPTSASRSSNGDVITFDFATPVTTTSSGFVIYTNATDFVDPPMIDIIDANGVGSLAPGYLPAVPEPATWAIIFIGVGMIGTAMRFGRNRKVAGLAVA
jgi:hypothetical protein